MSYIYICISIHKGSWLVGGVYQSASAARSHIWSDNPLDDEKEIQIWEGSGDKMEPLGSLLNPGNSDLAPDHPALNT